jgi:hypothetical protein
MPQLWAGCRCSIVEIPRSQWLSISEYHTTIIKIILAWPLGGNHVSAAAVELVSLNN